MGKASLCGFTFNIVKLKLVEEAQFTAQRPTVKISSKTGRKTKGIEGGKTDLMIQALSLQYANLVSTEV